MKWNNTHEKPKKIKKEITNYKTKPWQMDVTINGVLLGRAVMLAGLATVS